MPAPAAQLSGTWTTTSCSAAPLGQLYHRAGVWQRLDHKPPIRRISAVVTEKARDTALVPMTRRPPFSRAHSVFGTCVICTAVLCAEAQTGEKQTSPDGKYSVEVVQNNETSLVLLKGKQTVG